MLFTVKGMRETNILVAKGLYHDKFFTCLIGKSILLFEEYREIPNTKCKLKNFKILPVFTSWLNAIIIERSIFLKYKYHNGLNLVVHLYRGILKTLRVKTYKFRPVDEV